MYNLIQAKEDRPDRLNPKDGEKGEAYHNSYARYCVYAGLSNSLHQEWLSRIQLNKNFYKGEQWILEEDLGAFLKDETGEERQRIRVVKNLIRPMIESYRSAATKTKVNAKAKCISPKAVERRMHKLRELLHYTELQNQAPEFKDFISEKLPIGQTPEETMSKFDTFYVDDYVKAVNLIMDNHSKKNNFDDLQIRMSEEIAFSGLGVVKQYEHSGELVSKWLKSERYFWDRTAREYNHSDAAFWGDWDLIDAAEIFEMYQDISDTERKVVESYARLNQVNASNGDYSFNSIAHLSGGKIPVYRTYWRDVETHQVGYVKNEFGDIVLVKLNVIEPGHEEPKYTEKEIALDAGKRVIVVTPESMTMQRRKKHLTLIENVPKKKESVPLVIYDDDYL